MSTNAKASTQYEIGKRFVFGFDGFALPEWLKAFEQRFGLGGVILFDYDLKKKSYKRNIESKQQLQQLTSEVHRLASHPLVMIDQEGGKVRRLKAELGFVNAVSAVEFAALSAEEASSQADAVYRELAECGVDVNLAPVVDLNIAQDNPNIGAIGRSYGTKLTDLKKSLPPVFAAARKYGVGLCLKHYPGLGSAKVDSHTDLTDITSTWTRQEEEPFFHWMPLMSGPAVLMSHALHRDLEPNPDIPCSVSKAAISRLRQASGGLDPWVLSDDLQMQGLQKRMSTKTAVETGLRAGLDALIIGHNLLREEGDMFNLALDIEAKLETDVELQNCVKQANLRTARYRKAIDRNETDRKITD